MFLSLIFLAASLACLAYALVRRLPLAPGPPPPQRRSLLYPLERLVAGKLKQARIWRRSRAIQAAVEPVLIQIARLCEVRHQPFLALSDAAPLLDEPLRAEFQQALDDTRAGIPLEDALRALAHRCCDNFYLHQLAELVALTVRTGGDLAGNLQRLVARLRTHQLTRED